MSVPTAPPPQRLSSTHWLILTIASIGFDYYEHGKQAGRVVARILRGEAPGTIPVEFATGGQLFVNPGAASRMGITIPQAVVDRAATVVPRRSCRAWA